MILYKSKIIGIRIKTIMADGSNYFETRTFVPWKSKREYGDFLLPTEIQEVTGQLTCPIGVFILQFRDTSLAY